MNKEHEIELQYSMANNKPIKAKTLKKKLEFESSPEISKTVYVVDNKLKKKLEETNGIPSHSAIFTGNPYENNKPSIELIEKLEFTNVWEMQLLETDVKLIVNKINEIIEKNAINTKTLLDMIEQLESRIGWTDERDLYGD